MPTQADNTIIRAQLIKTYDDGEQQRMEVYGRHRERFGGTSGKNATPRIQEYGMSSHAPKGSQGHLVIPDGNPDKAMVHGMEHPKHRPTDLQEGEVKWYDMWDGYTHAKEDGWLTKVGTATIRYERDTGIVHINDSGDS